MTLANGGPKHESDDLSDEEIDALIHEPAWNKQAPSASAIFIGLQEIHQLIGHGLKTQRRHEGTINALAVDVAEIKGNVLRVESVAYTIAAARDLDKRDAQPPTVEQVMDMRKKYDRLVRDVQRTNERVSKFGAVAASAKETAEDTSKRAALTSEHALEVVIDQRDKAIEKIGVIQTTTHREDKEWSRQKIAWVIAFAMVLWTSGIAYAVSRLASTAPPPSASHAAEK